MVTGPDMIHVHVQTLKEVYAIFLPVCEPFKVSARLTEEFKLHLLELSGSESKVARSDFVSEGFTYLGYSERHFLSCGSLHISEVYEDSLCSFRSQINLCLGILCYTLESLKHQVELTDSGKIRLAAFRTRDVIFGNVAFKLFV